MRTYIVIYNLGVVGLTLLVNILIAMFRHLKSVCYKQKVIIYELGMISESLSTLTPGSIKKRTSASVSALGLAGYSTFNVRTFSKFSTRAEFQFAFYRWKNVPLNPFFENLCLKERSWRTRYKVSVLVEISIMQLLKFCFEIRIYKAFRVCFDFRGRRAVKESFDDIFKRLLWSMYIFL